MTTPPDVLVIRGAPCAGKSTLGRGLRRALTVGAVVEVDDVRAMLVRTDWSSRHQHDIALDVALHAIRRFDTFGMKPVVLIDTFSRGRLNHVRGWLEAADLRFLIVSLWVEPDRLRQRLLARTSGFTDWEPSRILNEEVEANRYPHEELIDTTLLSPDAVLAQVLTLWGLV